MNSTEVFGQFRVVCLWDCISCHHAALIIFGSSWIWYTAFYVAVVWVFPCISSHFCLHAVFFKGNQGNESLKWREKYKVQNVFASGFTSWTFFIYLFIYLVFHNFQVIKLQHVEKFKGGEYFCKALYLITILLPVPAFQQSFALRSMRT